MNNGKLDKRQQLLSELQKLQSQLADTRQQELRLIKLLEHADMSFMSKRRLRRELEKLELRHDEMRLREVRVNEDLRPRSGGAPARRHGQMQPQMRTAEADVAEQLGLLQAVVLSLGDAIQSCTADVGISIPGMNGAPFLDGPRMKAALDGCDKKETSGKVA
jgi:hypothetical protein